MKVNIVLHYWIGFVGMHLLVTRVIGVTFLPAVIYPGDAGDRVGRAGDPPARRPQRVPARFLSAAAAVFLLPRVQDRAMEISSSCRVGHAGADGVQRRHAHPADVDRRARHLLRCARRSRTRDWRPLAFVAVFGAAGLAYSAPKLLPVVQYVDRRVLLGHAQSRPRSPISSRSTS